MGRFRDLFKRQSKDDRANATKHIADADLPGANVAHLQVAGMQRTNQGNYITAYSSVNAVTTQQSAMESGNASCSSSTTAVGTGESSKPGESTWKGQPNGKPYDKRTELTQEDEEAWARMAM